jgi:hypothetical protein
MAESSACRSCGQGVRWMKTAKGKLTPVNLDGEPHWATCPNAGQWRNDKEATDGTVS